MHSFVETAPEITTATVKQVAELVKTFTKKKSRWTRIFCRRIAYSILASKDAAYTYLLIYLEQWKESVRKLAKQRIFFTTLSPDTHDSIQGSPECTFEFARNSNHNTRNSLSTLV
jgi:hypothetical protein